MKYRFLSPAEPELAEAAEYYDRAVPGLGLEFLSEVERTIARILRHPQGLEQNLPKPPKVPDPAFSLGNH